MPNKRALTIAIATPLGSAIFGNALVGDAATKWYQTLKKSCVILPLWAFIPIGARNNAPGDEPGALPRN